MRILNVIFDYADETEQFVAMRIEPTVTVTKDDITDVGIPAANYGFALGRIEEVMTRKGLTEFRHEEEFKVGGKIVATTKIYTFEYGRVVEIFRAINEIVNRCHASKNWDEDSRILIVNKVSFGNAV